MGSWKVELIVPEDLRSENERKSFLLGEVCSVQCDLFEEIIWLMDYKLNVVSEPALELWKWDYWE